MSGDRITLCRWNRFFFIRLLIFFVIFTIMLPGQIRGGVAAWSSLGASLSAPILVSGQVINGITNAPIARVLVRLNDRAVLTDDEGKFEFDQFTGSSNNNMQVTKPGFYLSTDLSEPPMLFLQPEQLSGPIQIRLYPEALLTGTVIDQNGDPLSQISVTAQRMLFDEIGRRWIPAAQSQTDSHGNFRLPVPAGDYRLETRYATRAGDASEAVLPTSVPLQPQTNLSGTIHIHSGEEQHYDLHPQISHAYTVTARVESSSERGFPGVIARSTTGATIPVSFQRNPASGEGKMQLPSGTYTLTASMFTSEGGEHAEVIVTIPDHDISGLVFHMTPNPSIPVELSVDSAATSDKSQPLIQQLGLMLQPTQVDPDRNGGMVGIITGRNRTPSFNVGPGNYRLQAKNNGEWYVKSASYGATDLFQQDLVVSPGTGAPIRVTVSNQTGALQGTVRLDGKPAVCWLYLIPTSFSVEPFIQLRSGTNGSYNIPHIPPGSYQAVAFERRHLADYRDTETLAAFMTHVRSVTVNAGDKSTLDLDGVGAAELIQ